MKLWKSLKISIGSRSDPKSYSQELPQWGGQGYELDVFKSQTSLSTDSGLCTERGLRRTHIELVKPPGKRIGLKLADNVANPIILSPENKENESPALEDIEPEMFNEVIDCEAEAELIPEEEEQLEENVLEILGVAPQTEAKGANLHKQIVEPWAIIVKKGLNKEEKERIQMENPPFTNFTQMTPPKLNPEVNAAVNDVARKRDQVIFKRQQQVATALSCLGSALQLSMKDQKLESIKKLNDASRLLCDSLFLDTRGRRSLLLSVTNKNMKEFLVQSEPGIFLFGDNLTDQIKMAKSVQKSGEELKIAQVKKFTPRPNTSGPRSSGAHTRSLNWRGPPRGEAKMRGGHQGQQAPRQADRRQKKDQRRK